ncbi:a-factor receptor [Pleurotus ostreatus]|nr:a-factor receptor [Pleurotus ostreatus]
MVHRRLRLHLLFFGFADEARKHYHNYHIAFDPVSKRVGYTTGGTMSSTGTFDEERTCPGMGSTGTGVTRPVFVHTDMITKRESYASFSDMSFTDAGVRGSGDITGRSCK